MKPRSMSGVEIVPNCGLIFAEKLLWGYLCKDKVGVPHLIQVYL